MMLYYTDYVILEALNENGGFLTGDVVSRVAAYAGENRRKASALMYRALYSLSAGGYVKEMDDKKPVCWVRTPKGTEALEKRQRRAKAE